MKIYVMQVELVMPNMLLRLLIIAVFTVTFHCLKFWEKKKEFGAVSVYIHHIPEICSHVKGLKVETVRLAYSEEELIEHYKMTFLVHFRDGITPALYGSIYHFDFDKQFFCMALPNGSIAHFHDRILENGKNNVIQELCHPIKRCEVYHRNLIFNYLR